LAPASASKKASQMKMLSAAPSAALRVAVEARRSVPKLVVAEVPTSAPSTA
jgi:hypothetical protein